MKYYQIMNICDENILASNAIKLLNLEAPIADIINFSNQDFNKIGIKNELIIERIKSELEKIKPAAPISISFLLAFGIQSGIIDILKNKNLLYAYELKIIPKEILKKKYGLTELVASKIVKAIAELDIFIDYANSEVRERINNISLAPQYQAILKRDILNALNDEYISYEDLFSKMRDCFQMEEIFAPVVDALADRRAIEFSLFGIRKLTLRLQEYLISLPDGRLYDMYRDYLYGVLYADMSKKYDIPVEKIKPTIEKIDMPDLVENDLLDFYKSYYFKAADFCRIFSCDESTFRYLDLIGKGKKGVKNILELLEDDRASHEIKLRVQNTLGEYAFINGVRVFKKPSTVFDLFVKNNSFEAVTPQALERYFIAYWKSLFFEDLEFKPKQFEAIINESMVIISSKEALRYYDTTAIDAKELISSLNLKAYQNVEISAKLLFDAAIDTMQSFDIHDEYELHSILKKIYKDNDIEFLRKTDMLFGDGNRNNQIKSLIIKESPINLAQFVRDYADSYGVKEKSFANYVASKFSPYYNDGILDCNVPMMTDATLNSLKALLIDDFYFIKDIYQLAYKQGFRIEEYYFQKNNMAKLGYNVSANYILKNKYASINDYLEGFFKEDILNLNEIDIRFIAMPEFSFILNKYTSNLEYIESEKGIYLKPNKLNNADFDRFAEGVQEFIYNDEIFTMTSLKKKGFSDELLALDYTDLFYSSILKGYDNFIFVKNSNYPIMKIKYVDDELNLGKLISQVLEIKGSMIIEVLIATLITEYGIDLKENQVKSIIKATGIYFDTQNQLYYVDYDAYLNR